MRFYSPEWVAAFNEAVAEVEVDPETSWRMAQVVHGGPEGSLTVVLSVTAGRISLDLDVTGADPPQVTMSVDYEDAVALSRGELDPARLLATGRVKVRGDVSVLVRGQALLAQTAERVAALSPTTTY